MLRRRRAGKLAKSRCSQAPAGSQGEVTCRSGKLTSLQGCGKASREGGESREVSSSEAGANVP